MNSTEVLNHWKMFVSLENDLIKLKNFIEIHVDNYNAYSFELSKILQLCCSEIDCVARLLCAVIDPSTNYSDDTNRRGNIADYKTVILSKFPKFILAEIYISGISDAFTPWAGWNNGNSPDWWEDYNKVKHYRHSSFSKANLKNALNSLSALMIIVLYLYREVSGELYANPSPAPQLLHSEYTSPSMCLRADKELPDYE
jgi:hypothetical protein